MSKHGKSRTTRGTALDDAQYRAARDALGNREQLQVVLTKVAYRNIPEGYSGGLTGAVDQPEHSLHGTRVFLPCARILPNVLGSTGERRSTVHVVAIDGGDTLVVHNS